MSSDYAKIVSEVFESLKLSTGTNYRGYDLDGEPGEYRIAYAVVEIAESATKLTDITKQLRNLESGGTTEDLLSEFSDELEHILYHVKDSGVFSKLLVD